MIQKRKLKLLLVFMGIFAAFIMIAGCGTDDDPKRISIKFIETTDIHGFIFPYDFVEDKAVNHSLAQIYTYVKEERKDYKNVILLDNGDILQGQPITNYYNYTKDPAVDFHIVPSVMNYMGYDAGTIGNHDIEPGHHVFDALVTQFNFPWMSANTIDTATGKPYFTPYAVIEREGLKVAVLGLTTPAIPNWLPEITWSGMEFEDMIDSASYWVEYIKEHENPDIMIGLFHAGYDYTYGGVDENTYKNENASVLVAEKVPGFDIIFIGHDHMVRDEIVNSVHIIGAKNAADSVATAEVTAKWNSKGQKWDLDIAGEVVDAKVMDPDPDFMAHFDYALQETKAFVSGKVCDFTESTSSRDSLFGDSSFNDLIHNLQFKVVESEMGKTADISFAAPLQFDKTINAGPVYVRDMYKLYLYENWLYLMELTGQEVKDAMEYSYSLWTNQMQSADDHLINFKSYDEATGVYETATRYYNYDSAAGILYDVDLTKPAGERVVIKSMADGTPFDLNATYLCAVNSYRGGGGGGHLTTGAGISSSDLAKRIVDRTARDLRYYLMTELEKEVTVTPKAIGNWKFIPEDWAVAGAAKDRAIIYSSDSGAH